MQALYELLERLAPTKTNILITGEAAREKNWSQGHSL